MSSITLSAIKKSFGKNEVIKGTDLQINKGEILALVGESGCGKTTILRMIAGLETVDSGKIFKDEVDITDNKAGQRKIGMLFQDLALFPHMTVQKNIAFGLKGDKSKIDELLKLTSLSGLEHRYPHELSGGQQQRAALARTLATDPDVLLLDEPFSSLDEITHEKVRNEIHQLVKSLGITTVLVTHHPIDSFIMADRVAILQQGRMLQLDTPERIYQNPVDAYVASFFGSAIVLAQKSAFGQLPVSGSQLFIRPEHMDVSHSEGPLQGVVVDKLFKGPLTILIIQSPDGNEQITLETRSKEFQTGDKIYLQPQIDQIKALT